MGIKGIGGKLTLSISILLYIVCTALGTANYFSSSNDNSSTTVTITTDTSSSTPTENK